MLKSVCIKTNNKKIINYLLTEFEKIDLKEFYISCYQFKIYNNIILHYKGNNLNLFYNAFSNIISSCIIKYYEKQIIKHIIGYNYFYFSHQEQQNINDIVIDYINNNEFDECFFRKNCINISCINYFKKNKSVNLDGFVKFRLNEYIKILDYIIDVSVNKFIIDREYLEFIDLLKNYVNSKEFNKKTIHLVYLNHESILLDEFKNIIRLSDTALDSKFVSDISFSSNDYTLNALLTLIPEKIYIHIIDEIEDEFINTLKLIFENRVFICNDCNICKAYRLTKTNKL